MSAQRGGKRQIGKSKTDLAKEILSSLGRSDQSGGGGLENDEKRHGATNPGSALHVVQLDDWSQYQRAFEVLIRVGGTFEGRAKHTLVVNGEQLAALRAARGNEPNDSGA